MPSLPRIRPGRASSHQRQRQRETNMRHAVMPMNAPSHSGLLRNGCVRWSPLDVPTRNRDREVRKRTDGQTARFENEEGTKAD